MELFRFVFGVVVLLKFCSGTKEEEYRTYDDLARILKTLQNTYPNITQLYSIGRSHQGRELLVLSVSSAKDDALGVPNIKIIGNIHGNEPVGGEIALRYIMGAGRQGCRRFQKSYLSKTPPKSKRERNIAWIRIDNYIPKQGKVFRENHIPDVELLQLIEYLLGEYSKGNSRIVYLLSRIRLHVLPSMNPDGVALARTYGTGEECDMESRGRNNVKGYDLNRNFPSLFAEQSTSDSSIQPETAAVVSWMEKTTFVSSLSLHAGSKLVVYPYDAFYAGRDSAVSPDDDVFRALASIYAGNHPTMGKESCKFHGNRARFPNGIVNGAKWYPIKGGMQDYNYVHRGCLELTVELYCCKFPRAGKLHQIWLDNAKPLLMWSFQTLRGVKGVIRDAASGFGISGAVLNVAGRDSTFESSERGEFWRILLPGSYNLTIIADGYESRVESFKIVSDGYQALWLNVTLRKVGVDGTKETTTDGMDTTKVTTIDVIDATKETTTDGVDGAKETTTDGIDADDDVTEGNGEWLTTTEFRVAPVLSSGLKISTMSDVFFKIFLFYGVSYFLQ